LSSAWRLGTLLSSLFEESATKMILAS